jgi:hypothetical protein
MIFGASASSFWRETGMCVVISSLPGVDWSAAEGGPYFLLINSYVINKEPGSLKRVPELLCK